MKSKKYLFFIVFIAFVSSCRYFQPSVMFKTPKGFSFDQFIDSVQKDYIIRKNDILTFRVFSNDGFKVLEMTQNMSGGGVQNNSQQLIQYSVESNGMVKFPVIGRQKIEGLSIREAEKFLEQKYTEFYNSPFVDLRVTNKRVIIFPGNEGTAKVLPLQNENTTLIEALAMSGGISNTGKAWKVKLIRGDLKNPTIYLFDLSKIESIKDAGMYLQANDIIYVEPTFYVAKELVEELAPILTILTTVLTIFVTWQVVKGI